MLFFVLICCLYCVAKPVSGSYLPGDSNKLKVLITHSYDPQSIKARKNKKALFAELVTALQNDLAAEIGSKTSYEPVIISETLTGGNDNTFLLSLMQKHKPAKTIVIKSFDIWFEQTGVEVTEDESGKTRTASFDICSNVLYELYDGSGKQQNKETKYREHFTKRSVASGFLSVGPDIVGKRKHAIILMQKNANVFIRSAGNWFSAQE